MMMPSCKIKYHSWFPSSTHFSGNNPELFYKSSDKLTLVLNNYILVVILFLTQV